MTPGIVRGHVGNAAGRSGGVSLIELLVVVTIIGILASIAYPSYRNYTLRAHRTDASRVLTVNAQVLQRCYSSNFTYLNCAGLSGTSPNGYYTIDLTNILAQTYTLTATATGTQANDTSCTTFTLDQTGKQAAANSGGTDTTQVCWGGT